MHIKCKNVTLTWKAHVFFCFYGNTFFLMLLQIVLFHHILLWFLISSLNHAISLGMPLKTMEAVISQTTSLRGGMQARKSLTLNRSLATLLTEDMGLVKCSVFHIVFFSFISRLFIIFCSNNSTVLSVVFIYSHIHPNINLVFSI